MSHTEAVDARAIVRADHLEFKRVIVGSHVSAFSNNSLGEFGAAIPVFELEQRDAALNYTAMRTGCVRIAHGLKASRKSDGPCPTSSAGIEISIVVFNPSSRDISA